VCCRSGSKGRRTGRLGREREHALNRAALALNLAQGRYNQGLASIVELTQAQLNVIQAEV
jgi:outer membrane protein TolC